MPIEDTYCHRLLTGRLSNVVPDAQANMQVRDLAITRAARVGAYIGVPLTGLDARLYVLCCLAHERRPQLGERDVLFLRFSETQSSPASSNAKRGRRHFKGSSASPMSAVSSSGPTQRADCVP